MHESIYTFLRRYKGDLDSWRTRQIVSLLFSEASVEFKREQIAYAMLYETPDRPGEDTVGRDQLRTTCQASTMIGANVTDEDRWEVGSGTNANARTIGDFTFEVHLIGLDQVPELLSITHIPSGVTSTAENLSNSFRRIHEASISVRLPHSRGRPMEIARLSCQGAPAASR